MIHACILFSGLKAAAASVLLRKVFLSEYTKDKHSATIAMFYSLCVHMHPSNNQYNWCPRLIAKGKPLAGVTLMKINKHLLFK